MQVVQDFLRPFQGKRRHDDVATAIHRPIDGRRERILHVAEPDPRTDVPGRQALVLRPLRRLKNRARYVVALRALKDTSGAAVAPFIYTLF